MPKSPIYDPKLDELLLILGGDTPKKFGDGDVPLLNAAGDFAFARLVPRKPESRHVLIEEDGWSKEGVEVQLTVRGWQRVHELRQQAQPVAA